MASEVFVNVGVILGIVTVSGLIARFLKQPLLVAFIFIGILVGPSALGIVVPSGEIELFAKLGIALLLFVVGLKLDLHVIRSVGPVALASGLGQVLITSAVGFVLARLLGLGNTESLYVAVALTFSSTIIIVKLLSDKREVDALHGRIAIGFLIVQDIVVVIVMILLTALGGAAGSTSIGVEIVSIIAKGLALLVAVYLLIRWILPLLLPHIAASSELLVLFAIAMAVLGGAAGAELGFSKEVGAFLAGVSLASTPYREQIAARLVTLRDFLLLFFFIELGATINLDYLGAQLPSALLLSIFVLIGNPIIVMTIMGFMGYRKRTGFLAGLTVAQISEFSLVLAALGLSLGHIDEQIVGLVALVGLITISGSTYMILYSHPLFQWLTPYLSVFERKLPFREKVPGGDPVEAPDIILVGHGRYGRTMARQLHDKGYKLLVVEMDADKVEAREEHDYNIAYGDASDEEFLSTLPLNEAKWLVCTIREGAVTRLMREGLERLGHQCKLAMTSPSEMLATRQSEQGLDLVLTPYTDAAVKATQRLEDKINVV